MNDLELNHKSEKEKFLTELSYLGFNKNDEYIQKINIKTFETPEFKEFKEKQELVKLESLKKQPLLKKMGLIILEKMAGDTIKTRWIQKEVAQYLQRDYRLNINNKLTNADLFSKNGKYSISSVVAGDNDLSIHVLTNEQFEFTKQKIDFKDKDKKEIIVPIKYLNQDNLEYDKPKIGEDTLKYDKITVFKEDPINDLMLNLDSVKSFCCNGKSSYFLSVDELIKWAKANDIKFKDSWIGWEY